MQLHFNGDNQKKLTEFHYELNVTGKSPVKNPLEGIPSYMKLSLKAFLKKGGNIKYMGCLKTR